MVTQTIIELPGGTTQDVINSLRNVAPTLSAKVTWRGKDLLEFSGQLPREVTVRIMLLSPGAVIKEKTNGKEHVLSEKVERVEGIVRCPNKNCITAQPKEPVKPGFRVISLNPLKLQCDYCGRYTDREAVLTQLRSGG